MRRQFKVSFYLRSNYENKEGKSPIMLRIFLNREMANLGTTKLFVKKSMWNNSTSRMKGRTAEALTLNASLDSLSTSLYEMFGKMKEEEDLTVERLKQVYLGRDKEFTTLLPVIDRYLDHIAQQVGKSLSKDSLQKYTVVKTHFVRFLKSTYNREDIGLLEFTPSVVMDFELYLKTKANLSHNTAQKKLKLLKTMTIFAQKRGIIMHDPFLDIKFHTKPVDRGFLTEDEVSLIVAKDLTRLPRLELVRDIFIFSCFTGLAYIDVRNLTPEDIVVMDDKEWVMSKRKKTNIAFNVLLLDLPKAIISKYNHDTYRDGKLFPILSNQKMNSYLKEIADICGIKKNLTFHLARHTFATLCLSKGVPMESVSKMLGHTNIRTTQIYARITNKKIEHDMEQFADKLGKFNTAMGIGENSWQ